jgi:hypothetical protein
VGYGLGGRRFIETCSPGSWLQPNEALGIVRRHLAPEGAVYLFWDARHTQPGRARDLADRLSERIRLAEFSVSQVLVKDLRPVPAVCVIGRGLGALLWTKPVAKHATVADWGRARRVRRDIR